MLLPALAKSKEKANRIYCTNNQKQLMLATHLYPATLTTGSHTTTGTFTRSGPAGVALPRLPKRSRTFKPARFGNILATIRCIDALWTEPTPPFSNSAGKSTPVTS
jgi:hypothetical protein